MANVDTSVVDQTVRPVSVVDAVASVLKQSKDTATKLQDIAKSNKTGEYGEQIGVLLRDIATINNIKDTIYSSNLSAVQLSTFTNTMSSFLNTLKDMIAKNDKLNIDLICLVFMALINDKIDVNILYAHENSYNNEKEAQLLHMLVHTFRYLADAGSRTVKLKAINFAVIPEPYGNILKEYFTR